MRPSSREGKIVLETFQELNESEDALCDVPGTQDLAMSLDREPPFEVHIEDALLIIEGLRVTLARENLAEDYRPVAQHLLDDYKRMLAIIPHR